MIFIIKKSSTFVTCYMLETLITSKTRLRLLVKFFISITNKGHLNSLANEFGESTNSVRKELNNLSSAGYLKKHSEDNKVIYKANISHPLFKTIQQIIRKHLGIEELLESVYNKIGDVEKVILLGDYAKGIDSGLIEVLIVGKNINKKYLDIITPKIEKKIKRKVNFFVSNKVLKQVSLTIFEF
ncbi:ArsR family transcriptional regulator [Flavobacteriaceae bacterium]|nr:ArsR family transcriptional regulator [Flavobacteriaceae bacterium]